VSLRIRESVADLVAKGLHESEAFTVASLRLGTPDKLSKEFCKVNGNYVWKGRIQWILFGFVGGKALASIIDGIGTNAGAGTAFFGFSGTSAGLVDIAATLVCWTIVFLWLWQSGRRAQTVAINGVVSNGWLILAIALWGFGLSLSIVGSMSMNYAINLMLTSKVSGEFPKFLYWQRFGGLAINVCVVATCVAIIVVLRRSRVEETETIA